MSIWRNPESDFSAVMAPVLATLPPPPPPPRRAADSTSRVASSAVASDAGGPGPAVRNDSVIATLALDQVVDAHQRAFDLALDAVSEGANVVHLRADPGWQAISFADDGTHDLTGAVTSIPTAAGRLIRVDIGGLDRLQVADVIASLRPVADQIYLSGPGIALSQLSLEFATLADVAITIGGTDAERTHLSSILHQLGVAHRREPAVSQTSPSQSSLPPPPDSARRIKPPGRI